MVPSFHNVKDLCSTVDLSRIDIWIWEPVFWKRVKPKVWHILEIVIGPSVSQPPRSHLFFPPPSLTPSLSSWICVTNSVFWRHHISTTVVLSTKKLAEKPLRQCGRCQYRRGRCNLVWSIEEQKLIYCDILLIWRVMKGCDEGNYFFELKATKVQV